MNDTNPDTQVADNPRGLGLVGFMERLTARDVLCQISDGALKDLTRHAPCAKYEATVGIQAVGQLISAATHSETLDKHQLSAAGGLVQMLGELVEACGEFEDDALYFHQNPAERERVREMLDAPPAA